MFAKVYEFQEKTWPYYWLALADSIYPSQTPVNETLVVLASPFYLHWLASIHCPFKNNCWIFLVLSRIWRESTRIYCPWQKVFTLAKLSCKWQTRVANSWHPAGSQLAKGEKDRNCLSLSRYLEDCMCSICLKYVVVLSPAPFPPTHKSQQRWCLVSQTEKKWN